MSPRAARFLLAFALATATLLPASLTAAETVEELPVGGGPDLTRPSVAGLKLAPVSFKPAAAGASVTSGRRGGVGTKVSFDLSEVGRVTFGVQERQLGRRVGGTCRAQSAVNKGNPGCIRFVEVAGSFSVDAGEGINSVFFSGRVGGRSLAAASYRLTAVARDGTGNESLPANAEFSVRPR